MKKRIVYRYTGKDAVLIGERKLRPGGFISRKLYECLPKEVTIRQEIWVGR